MKNLAEMWTHFPHFAASTILMSALQSMNGSMLENAYEDPTLRPCSLPFVEYRRLLTGVPEAMLCSSGTRLDFRMSKYTFKPFHQRTFFQFAYEALILPSGMSYYA
ncbi:hypothetical protein AcW1_001373 [Taiwanofungus camphoratus]|nr:hypothetical protein AcV5_005300 [Antrodia cinnamomea]KAI0964586.1 hypothetical protein AcW1_001373 [Antrodia cinnamomea]